MFQLADGTWIARIEAGRGPDGTRKRIVRKARTRGEAIRKLKEAERHLDDHGFVPDQRTTVEAYLRFWLEEVVPGTIKESTADGYRGVVDRWLIPHLGARPLAKLDASDVTKMLRTMEAAGLSVSTRRQARAIIRRALRTAEQYGYVTRNVAALVDPPKANGAVRPTTDDTLTPAEVRHLIDTLTAPKAPDPDRQRSGRTGPDRLVALAELVTHLGLRKGEVMALRWADVDLAAGTLAVVGTLKRRKTGEVYIDTPKTAAATRVLPLSPRLVGALKAHRRRQAEERLAAGELWADGDYVFTTRHGAPLESRNLFRWWHSALDEAGLDRRPFHATRRTAITNMAEAGVPLEVAARIVGHAGIRMTAEVYARVRPKATADALALLEAHLEASGST